MIISIEEFIGLRNKVIEDIQRRLDEISSLAENATLILGKKDFKSIDLSIIETIVRLIDFKFSAIYSNTDFIEVVSIDSLMWRDIKENIIDTMRGLIEAIGRNFAKLSTAMESPEILLDEERNTVNDLKGQLRDLFSDLLRKIRNLGKYTPKQMSEDQIKDRIKEVYG